MRLRAAKSCPNGLNGPTSYQNGLPAQTPPDHLLNPFDMQVLQTLHQSSLGWWSTILMRFKAAKSRPNGPTGSDSYLAWDPFRPSSDEIAGTWASLPVSYISGPFERSIVVPCSSPNTTPILPSAFLHGFIEQSCALWQCPRVKQSVPI